MTPILEKDLISFYLAFKDVHPSWSLIGCAMITGIIATFGIILNSSVIHVTIKTKTFRGTVNYILAFYSLLELLHELGHFLFVYTALSGQNFIECLLAAKILFVSAIGIGGSFATILFTGFERLIAIVFSEIYDKSKKRLYLAAITIICVCFGCFFAVSMYQEVKDDYGDSMITGNYADFFRGKNYLMVLIMNVVTLFVLMTIVIYLLLFLAIRIKSTGLPSADSINRRTLRALFCIVGINVGGYLIGSIYVIRIKPTLSPITAWFGHQIFGAFLNIGAASNGPILYFTSTEYRQAYHKAFPSIFKRNSNTNQIATLQNNFVRGTV